MIKLLEMLENLIKEWHEDPMLSSFTALDLLAELEDELSKFIIEYLDERCKSINEEGHTGGS